MFSAQDVKKLRDQTGAGMLDCKKALDACKGNIDEAMAWLREKGISKAQKKAERIAAEGISIAMGNDNIAAIGEINCETDFVAKNEEFKKTSFNIVKTIMSNPTVKTIEEANNLKLEDSDQTIGEAVIALTAKLGEKISFRRFEVVEKKDNEVFGIYSHMGGRITGLVVLSDTDRDVARDVAMHLAAMNPKYLNKDEVPSEVLDKEKEIMKTQLINEGKPENRIEQILIGKVNKFYEEVCLENQIFIKAENKESVGKYVANNGGTIVKMVRYEVGEGIEKRNEDFAAEVSKQINA